MGKQIAVIGGGVSGLTTAVKLQEAGYTVELITEKTFESTTSIVAAAIWFPYHIQPIALTNKWSLATYHELEKLTGVTDSGVTMTTFKLYHEKEEDAVWKSALPANNLSAMSPNELPPGFPMGYRATVPLCETQIYLPYLQDRFRFNGGKVIFQKVKDLQTLSSQYEAVINCTGMGSQELINDQELYPIFGQLVKVDLQDGIESTSAEMPVSDNDEETAYVIKRSDCMVLGGTVMKGYHSDEPVEALNRGIIERCQQLVPELKVSDVKGIVAGVRPGRTTVRLEREGNIIHNYGHGGSGYTVSWGCASEVLSILDEYCTTH
ncbi:MAG: FAD-dependent oxidoreductase [Bacteroidota bacterium]